MAIVEYLPTRSETEHADAARDEAERGPEPPPMDWQWGIDCQSEDECTSCAGGNWIPVANCCCPCHWRDVEEETE